MTYCITDKQIKFGKHPSGLTYYIRHNETPKGLACFYLVKNFGSVVEDDNEKGFAHFLEHMSFEGSRHFPDNEMTRYLESIGVRFGEECNAYTSSDETVYTLKNVPVTKEICSNCLSILSDWISGITLNDKAIEIEKSIILEEFRVASSPMYRMIQKMLPTIYKGCKYADSSILGKYEIIENISPQSLRNFYHKWSRPDLAAIIIVGDFDAEEMETQVRAMDFSVCGSNVERNEVTVPDSSKPIIAIERDSEQGNGRLAFLLKRDVYDREYIKTYECLRDAYILELIVRMLNSRYMYISNGNSSPFVDPYVSIGDFVLSRTKQAIDIWIDFDMENFDSAVTTVYREIRRAVLYGFTDSELQKAKTGWLSSMTSQYLDRENRTNQDFAEEYQKHFTHYEPLPSIDDEYDFAKRTIPMISVDEINNVASTLYNGNNLVVLCFLPSSSVQTEEYLLSLLDSVDNQHIDPSLDIDSADSLVPELLLPSQEGYIVSKSDYVLGYRKYLLSNGVSVYLKTTDFSEDKILIYAISKSGKYSFDISDYRELYVAESIVEIGGLGQFSKQQLYSFLEDKQVEFSTLIDPLLCKIKGKCAVNNIEELLQSIYLIFTSPRYDKDSFGIWKEKTISILKNKEKDYLSETLKMINHEQFVYHKFYNSINSSEIEMIDYDRAYTLFRKCFSNAADFSFIITGAISDEELTPYLEKYIASLPVDVSSGKKAYHHIVNSGDCNIVKKIEMESPSSYSITLLQNEAELTFRNIVMTDLLIQTIDMDVIKEVRQKDGNAYLAYADGNISLFEPSVVFLYILLQTNVGLENNVNETVDRILESYVANGPSEENLIKAKEYTKKRYHKEIEENKFFQIKLSNYLVSQIDEVTDFEKVLSSISIEELKSFAYRIISEGRKKRCVITSK